MQPHPPIESCTATHPITSSRTSGPSHGSSEAELRIRRRSRYILCQREHVNLGERQAMSTSITIPDPDDELSTALEARAKKRGTTIGDEARRTLLEALQAPEDLGAAIRERFAPLGGVDLELPKREPIEEPPDLAR